MSARAAAQPLPAVFESGAALPLPVTAAVLTAFAAFATFLREPGALFLLGALYLAPYITRARGPSGRAANVGLRLMLFAGAAVFSALATRDFRTTTVYAGWVQVATRICIIELILQNWRRVEAGLAEERRTVGAILLSAAVFAAASKTIDAGQVFLYFAVPYFFFVAFALRAARRRDGGDQARWFAAKAWTHVAALLLVLMLATTAARYVGSHKRTFAPIFQLGGGVQPAANAVEQSVGFSESPVLNRTQNATRSTERVLSVSGALPDPYLRGLVFDRYRGGRWLRLTNAQSAADMPSLAAVTHAASETSTAGERVEIQRISDYISVLFVPLNAAAIGCESPELLELDGPRGCTLAAFASAPFQYGFSSESPGQRGPLNAQPTAEQRRHCLEVPSEVDSRVLALARKITEHSSSDQQRVDAVTAYLRTNIGYSLNARIGRGDPVSEFVLNKNPAHCEYFASAAALMLRAVHVPARYVTGFYAHESQGSNRFVVRQQDAHAWCECWIDGAGWVTADATPSSGIPAQLSAPISAWSGLAERANDLYLMLLHWICARTRTEWIALAVLGGAILLAVQIWRRTRRRRNATENQHRYSVPEPAYVELSERFEHFMLKRRIPCPPSQTWQEHFAALSQSDASIRGGVDMERCSAFVHAYNQLRFGPAGDREKIRGLSGDLKALEKL